MPNDIETIPSSGSHDLYTVQAGDTLESISERHYGVKHLWPRIRNANREHMCYGGLQCGSKLVIPR